MFDQSRLKADQQNLTGLLLIKARNGIEGGTYFLLTSVDTKKLLDLVRDVPEGLEAIIGESEELSRRISAGLGGGIGEGTGFWVYGLVGLALSADFPVRPHDDLDVYELGSCGDAKEFQEHTNGVVAWYFSRYNVQQQGKQKTSSAEALKTIAETPAENVAPRLYGLSARLLHAISDRNPLAQLEAEDSLHAFAFGNAFRYSVEQIVRLASSMRSDRSDLIGLHCRIIGAIAREDYKCAKDLQSLYERSMQLVSVRT